MQALKSYFSEDSSVTCWFIPRSLCWFKVIPRLQLCRIHRIQMHHNVSSVDCISKLTRLNNGVLYMLCSTTDDVVCRDALGPRLADWHRAQLLTYFLLLKRAQTVNVPYMKWAYQIWSVSHLISKSRQLMRPCKIHSQGYFSAVKWFSDICPSIK